MRDVGTVILSAGLLAICAAGAASAASGLSVRPPRGYAAKPVPPTGGYTEAFEVSSRVDPDAGCEIGFRPAAPGGLSSQAAINAAVSTPRYAETVRDSVAAAYDIAQILPAANGDVRGLVIVGRPRGAPAAVQSLLFVFDTPRGRTSVACVASAGNIAARTPDFEAVARGVVLPR